MTPELIYLKGILHTSLPSVGLHVFFLSLLSNVPVKNPLAVANQWQGKNPFIVAKQRFDKNVTAATNTYQRNFFIPVGRSDRNACSPMGLV
jgi:hypothetical protein